MPRHQQVTTCRRNGGPISRRCTCEHCNLFMCAVCGAYEGGLTTDCPGTRVDFDQQREVHETSLDYTDDRGWHQGTEMEHRSPRFTSTRLPPTAPRIDPRSIVAPTINWPKVDQNKALQHELTLRAIAWVLSDRQCDELAVKLVRARDGAGASGEAETGAPPTKLEEIQINFQHACQHVEECDDELRQTARQLVDALEAGNRLREPRSLPNEFQGSIHAEHLPHAIKRLTNALDRLLEDMPEFDGGLPLVEQLAKETALLQIAAREACLHAGIPWVSKLK